MTSVLTLVSGIAVAQGINFVGIPILARLYTPEAIGDYTLITSSSSIIMSVACLGMMTVFLLPKSDEEARGLARLVSVSTVSISAIIVIGLLLLSEFFKLFSTEEVSYSVSLLVLWCYVVFYTVINICYAYVNRRKLYKVMFWNPVIGASANIVLGIIFGIIGLGFVGYTLAHILGFAFNIIHLTRFANPYKKDKNTAYKAKDLLKKYNRFPKYQMPANVISTISIQMPVQMFGLIFGGTILGMYSMSMKILALPAILLATPINRVYFKEANDRYSKGEEIGNFTFKILKTNIKLALVPIIIITIWGEEIFTLLLGNNWAQAGQFASILAAYELMIFCVKTVSGGLVILGKNNLNLYISIGSLLLNIAIFLLIATFFKEEPTVAIMLVAFSGIIIQAITLGVFLKFAKVKLKKYIYFLSLYVFIPYFAAYLVKIFLF